MNLYDGGSPWYGAKSSKSSKSSKGSKGSKGSKSSSKSSKVHGKAWSGGNSSSKHDGQQGKDTTWLDNDSTSGYSAYGVEVEDSTSRSTKNSPEPLRRLHAEERTERRKDNGRGRKLGPADLLEKMHLDEETGRVRRRHLRR